MKKVDQIWDMIYIYILFRISRLCPYNITFTLGENECDLFEQNQQNIIIVPDTLRLHFKRCGLYTNRSLHTLSSLAYAARQHVVMMQKYLS